MTAAAHRPVAALRRSLRVPLISVRTAVDTAAFGSLLVLCLVFGLGDVNEFAPAGSMVMPPLRVLLVVVIVLAGISKLLNLARTTAPDGLVLPLGVWLTALVLSAATAPTHQSLAFEALNWPIQNVLLCLAVYHLTQRLPRWRGTMAALGVGGAAVAVVGLLQAANVGLILDWLKSLHDGAVPLGDVARVSATLSHPNVAALVFELTLPLLIAAALLSRERPRQFAFAALATAVLVALVLTFSRAGLLASMAGLAVIGALAIMRGARRTVILLAVGGVSILLATLGVALFTHFGLGYRLLAELDQSGYRVAYDPPASITATPAEVLFVPLTLTNYSSAPFMAAGPGRVALGYHLLEPQGRPIVFDSPVTLLPTDLAQNASQQLEARVHAPLEPGTYTIQWDAVRQSGGWFSWRGAEMATTQLIVQPGPAHEQASADTTFVLPGPARVQLWAAAWAMFREYPILGVGLDNFRVRFGDYSGVPEWKTGTHAHSMYLEALADTGLVGVAALVWLLVMVLRLATRGLLSEPDRAVWAVRAALLASLIAWMVHGTVDDLGRFWPPGAALWIIIGLTARGADAIPPPRVDPVATP